MNRLSFLALLVLATPSLAISVTESTDMGAFPGTSYTLDVGGNTVSGTLQTTADAQDNFQVVVPANTQLTAVSITFVGGGFNGSATFNLNESRTTSGSFSTGLPASSGGGFGTSGAYTMQLAANFSTGTTWTASFTVVALGNAAPTNVSLSNSTIAENAAANATVGNLSSTDPDVGNTFTYSLVAGTGSTDNAAFNISGSTLRATSAFNFETRSSYSVRVRTTDQGNLFFERAFTITVTNVNETPTDITLGFSTVAENSLVGQPIGAFSTVDPDASNTFTYSILPGADGALFSISGNTLQVNGALNFEAAATRTVNLQSTDQGGLSTTKSFVITITNVNEAPTALSLSNATVAEAAAGATVGALTPTDPDANSTFTYTILSGGNGAQFTLVGNSLRVGATGLDFEAGATRSVSVRATDQGGLFVDNTFTITVTNVNEAPIALSLSAAAVDENAPNAAIGTLSTVDQDANNTFTYSIASGGDGALFTIVGTQLRVGATGLDFEANSTRSVTVVTTDQGGLAFSRTFTISVNNLNEAPTDIALSSATVAENASTVTVGTLTTTDPDAANMFTYSIVAGGDGAQFSLSGNTLRVASTLDFEAGATRTVTIRSADQGGLATQKTFTITVTNVNEAPTNITLSNASVFEYSANMTVGAFSSVDPDVGDTFTYTLSGTDAASFRLTGNQLSVGPTVLKRSEGATRSIRIRTTDAGGQQFEKDFTITVLPFDVSGCNTIPVTPTMLPASTFGQPITSVTMMAAMAELPVTFSLTGTLPTGVTFAAGVFTGTPTQGGMFSVTVTATDNRGCTGSTPVTLGVTCPVSVGMNQTVCGPASSMGLAATTPGSGVTGTWSAGSAGGTFSPTATDPNATWQAPANFSGTATLTWTLSGQGCDGTSASASVAVTAPGPSSCCNTASDCDDGDPCTTDSCASAACTHTAMACMADGGTPDAGTTSDAGAPDMDAGQPIDDGGQSTSDAGQPTDDAGMVMTDAGLVPNDAGVLPDGGQMMLPDGGDGGGGEAMGCSCGTDLGAGAGLWALAFAVFALRRRRVA